MVLADTINTKCSLIKTGSKELMSLNFNYLADVTSTLTSEGILLISVSLRIGLILYLNLNL